MRRESFVLTVRCKDDCGILAAVASALTAAGAFITESSQRRHQEADLFHMRTVFHSADGRSATLADFRAALLPVERRFGLQLELQTAGPRIKGMLAVSRDSPCLDHLLQHWHSGGVPVDIVGVVSNQQDLQRLLEWYDATSRPSAE